MINEYEQNPRERMQGMSGWSCSIRPHDAVSLSGWTIETMHGMQRCDDMGDVLLMPHSPSGLHVQQQALDNQGEGKFPIMESVVLRDSSGKARRFHALDGGH